jgi:hypothetical protein
MDQTDEFHIKIWRCKQDPIQKRMDQFIYQNATVCFNFISLFLAIPVRRRKRAGPHSYVLGHFSLMYSMYKLK